MPEGGRGRRLVAAVLAAALMPLNSTMIAVALPRISDELGHDPAVVTQALVTSYLVAAVVLQSPAGKVGDRLGHPRMLLIGQVVVALGALMGYVAGSLGLLVAARVLMATGGAVLVPATVALLRHELPPQRRGRGFGAFGAVMALAAALGPLVGGELVHLFGWRSVFVANVPLLLLSAALAGKAPPAAAEPDRTPPPRFDWLGSGLLAVGLSAVVLGLRPDGAHAVVLLVAGVAVLVPFAVWERRASDPVVAFDLFRSAPFSAGTLLIAVQNLVMYALLFEVPLIAAALFGLDARGTGWLLVCLMLAMVITSPVAGRLVDRVGARAVALAGSGFTLVGIAVLGSTDLSTPRQVAVPLVLLGVGLGLATPAAQSASMSAAPQDRTGMAAGVGSTMRYLGGLVGVAVLSLVLDVRGSRAEVVSDHRSLMAFFGCALAVGMASSALLPGRTRSAARQGG